MGPSCLACPEVAGLVPHLLEEKNTLETGQTNPKILCHQSGVDPKLISFQFPNEFRRQDINVGLFIVNWSLEVVNLLRVELLDDKCHPRSYIETLT